MTKRRLLARRPKARPHAQAYTRLAPSRIHGVGVFAIRDIPRGAAVFGADDDRVVRVPSRLVAAQPNALRKLYEDFCVLRGAVYLCPVSFNALTVSWYVNHADVPNIAPDPALRFRALRRIRKGEELVADYNAYSDPVPPRMRRTTRR